MRISILSVLWALVSFFGEPIFAKEIDTNSVYMAQAPDWLRRTEVEKVIDRIQMHMEWTIRKIQVTWYTSQAEFEKAHRLGPSALAVSKQADNTIHMGPKITKENFAAIFGHELVHIISFQKYKTAIPRWLEEGIANFMAKHGQVNYKWLSKQPYPADVRTLTHPFSGTLDGTKYHYQASHALAEMLNKKCDLTNLLRLSVERNMEDYIRNYCQIPDLNAEFKKWVTQKAKI